eukprot:XP_024306834.1 uncharacterized protein LOC105371566 [Homo sapiens]
MTHRCPNTALEVQEDSADNATLSQDLKDKRELITWKKEQYSWQVEQHVQRSEQLTGEPRTAWRAEHGPAPHSSGARGPRELYPSWQPHRTCCIHLKRHTSSRKPSPLLRGLKSGVCTHKLCSLHQLLGDSRTLWGAWHSPWHTSLPASPDGHKGLLGCCPPWQPGPSGGASLGLTPPNTNPLGRACLCLGEEPCSLLATQGLGLPWGPGCTLSDPQAQCLTCAHLTQPGYCSASLQSVLSLNRNRFQSFISERRARRTGDLENTDPKLKSPCPRRAEPGSWGFVLGRGCPGRGNTGGGTLGHPLGCGGCQLGL